jgi:hypothetical protein
MITRNQADARGGALVSALTTVNHEGIVEMAACQITTHPVAATASAANVFFFDPFIPLASEFLRLVSAPGTPDDIPEAVGSRIVDLEGMMTCTPPQSMAGALLGLKVIKTSTVFEWSDLEDAVLAACINILEAGE